MSVVQVVALVVTKAEKSLVPHLELESVREALVEALVKGWRLLSV